MDRLFAILAIILKILIAPVQQSTLACVTATSDLVASMADAQAGPRCLDIPAGVYSIGAATSGAWLNATVDNLEIKGAGAGKTILQITQPLTLTQDFVVLRLFGVNQHVHDLTVQLGTGHTGTGSIGGIVIYGSGGIAAFAGRAERAEIDHVEITGGYSANGSGGYAIGTYRLSTDKAAAQWNTIQDNWIHDSPSTGIGVNSNNNLLLHNRIERVGASPLAHGFYAQGGYNVYDGNYVSGASGYSFHGWKHVPSIDASGDRYVNNTSIDPGVGHMVINGIVGNLTRNVVIAGNLFRNTGGRFASGVAVDQISGAIISNNIFEDVLKAGSATIDTGPNAGGAIISGNRLAATIPANGGGNIRLLSPALVEGNVIDGANYAIFWGDLKGVAFVNNVVR